jgi:chromosome segregation ATPase
MSRFLGLCLLVVAIAIGAYVGCGPRMGVAKDKVIAKIDEMLGKLDVKLKKVEMAYADVESSTEGLRESRIKARLNLEKLQADAKKLEDEKAKLLAELTKVFPLLKAAQESGSTEYNGKVIPLDKLNDFAVIKKNRLKSINDQLDNSIKTLTNAYAKNLEAIKKNEDTSKSQLAQLTNQIDEIKSKKSALDAMKEASSIVAPGVSLSDKFEELTKDVDDLLVDVDVQMQTEMEKIDERAAELETSTTSLEELLNDKTDASGTLSDIEAMLKNEGN